MYHTFLACNSEKGFISLFDEMTNKRDHRIFLIKGGPGTGKSSFMKMIALSAADRGEEVEQIHCSSDPESLDGVYIPGRKIVLLDATAPHCVDPSYVGAVERILPFGEFLDNKLLQSNADDIIGITDRIRRIFAKIYALLRSSGQLRYMSRRILSDAFCTEKADGVVAKFLRQQAVLPTAKYLPAEKRIITALTGNGFREYDDIFKFCDRVLVIEDGYDAADLWMQRAERQLYGCKRIHLVNPLCPDEIDHIILPEHRIGIVSHNPHTAPDITGKAVRTLHFKSAVYTERLTDDKESLSFAKKNSRTIYEQVAELMTREKALHDELERYYIGAMDFTALDQMTKDFITKEL